MKKLLFKSKSKRSHSDDISSSESDQRQHQQQQQQGEQSSLSSSLSSVPPRHSPCESINKINTSPRPMIPAINTNHNSRRTSSSSLERRHELKLLGRIVGIVHETLQREEQKRYVKFDPNGCVWNTVVPVDNDNGKKERPMLPLKVTCCTRNERGESSSPSSLYSIELSYKQQHSHSHDNLNLSGGLSVYVCPVVSLVC